MHDDTSTMRAAECRYFVDRGWTEAEVAVLLGCSERHVSHLLATRLRHRLHYCPTPADIAAGMARCRPTHQQGIEGRPRSPAAILEHVIALSDIGGDAGESDVG